MDKEHQYILHHNHIIQQAYKEKKMKGLRLKKGGDANLEFIKSVSPVLAQSYSAMLSNIKDPTKQDTFKRRAGQQIAAYRNMPEEQQKAFVSEMTTKYSSPTKETFSDINKSLEGKYRPVYQVAATRKSKPTVAKDIYKELGLAKTGGIAIRGNKFKGVF